MPVKSNTTEKIKCKGCRTTTSAHFKPATAYCETTRFVCDCGRVYHITDYMNGITTHREVTQEFDDEWVKEMEEHENRNRVKCNYPMSEFYTYADEIPAGTRVSTPEDCEKCEGMKGCEDSKHCLFEDSRHCLKKKTTFKVSYEIEVDAEDHEQAALEAEDCMRNGHYRPYLKVVSSENVTKEIDLEQSNLKLERM